MAMNNLFKTRTLASKAKLGLEFIKLPLPRARDIGTVDRAPLPLIPTRQGHARFKAPSIVTTCATCTQGQVYHWQRFSWFLHGLERVEKGVRPLVEARARPEGTENLRRVQGVRPLFQSALGMKCR